jgi:hypothetical protein
MTPTIPGKFQIRIDELEVERDSVRQAYAVADGQRGPEARAAREGALRRLLAIDAETTELRELLTVELAKGAAPRLADAVQEYRAAARALVSAAARVHAVDTLVNGAAPPTGILLTVPAVRVEDGDALARELRGVHLGNGAVQVAEDVTGPVALAVYTGLRAELLGTAS